jgi:hypothetical protein
MMSMEALKRLMAPAFFLLVFLLPAIYVDDAILQVSSHLLQRAIRIGHYVIGIGLWLTLAWLGIRVIEVMVWPLVMERRRDRITPQLLKDFVRLLVIVVALGAIISDEIVDSEMEVWKGCEIGRRKLPRTGHSRGHAGRMLDDVGPEECFKPVQVMAVNNLLDEPSVEGFVLVGGHAHTSFRQANATRAARSSGRRHHPSGTGKRRGMGYARRSSAVSETT